MFAIFQVPYQKFYCLFTDFNFLKQIANLASLLSKLGFFGPVFFFPSKRFLYFAESPIFAQLSLEEGLVLALLTGLLLFSYFFVLFCFN